MRVKHLAAGLVACAALWLASDARAGDLHRLAMPGDFDAGTFDLKVRPGDKDAELSPTWFRARGWGGGWYGGGFRYGVGFRSFGGFYGGGFGPRFYGGFGPRFVGGFGGPFYGGFNTRIIVGGGFYGPGFWPGPFYGPGFFPCSLDGPAVITPPAIPAMPRAQDPRDGVPMPMPGAEQAPNGTFDYDGGPKAPVPMPRGAAEETVVRSAPRKPMIVNEFFVSDAKPTTGKWVYPAYGETAHRER